MRFYHGTIKPFAERIKREGLKAVPRNQFNVEMNGTPIRSVEVSQPHVTEHQYVADRYASFRAQYERLPYGGKIEAEDWHAESTKLSHFKRVNAEPVTLVLDIPEEWILRHLYEDPFHNYGAVADTTIPPEFIVGETKQLGLQFRQGGFRI